MTNIFKTFFLTLLFLALVACDGTLMSGEPAISFEPYPTTAIAGRGPVLLRVKSTSSTILWEVLGSGSLEINDSKLSAYYTPPTSVTSSTTVSVKVMLEGTLLSDQATLTVNPVTVGTSYTVNATLSSSNQKVIILAADNSGSVTNAVVKVNDITLPLKASLLGLYEADITPALGAGQAIRLEVTLPEGVIQAHMTIPALGQSEQLCGNGVFTGPATRDSCMSISNQ